MKRAFLFLIFLCLATQAKAQTWSGILHPTSGAGFCTFVPTASPGACGIDWSTAGVPGGIPSGSWTQSGSTITATSGDRTATIQAALNACGTNHYVLEGQGVFNVTNLHIPTNCELRGVGTLTSTGTVNNAIGTSGAVYTLGGGGPYYSAPASANITSGATAGSTSIVVNSASGISTGTLLAISEKNDPVYVAINTSNGVCSWCDGTVDGGIRARGQIVLVTAVSGTTLTISPALYTNYGTAAGTSPALAYYFQPGAIHAGVENLQTYSNGTGYSQVYNLTACRECWVKGVFNNYADADHADLYWSYHSEIRDSYFSNAYLHTPGTSDSQVDLANMTSATLVENNIFERLHIGVMMEWGAAGNVVGYNYEIGNFDSGSLNVILAFIDFHGAHPQFNLFEGNIGNNITMDSFWGTGSNNTVFRNQFRGTDTLASPETAGRHVVNWASTTLAFQQMVGEQLAFPHTNNNSVGNVHGSADASTAARNGKYNSGTAPFTSTILPSATRSYEYLFSAISVGYNTGSDSNGASVASFSGGPGPTTGYWVGKASGTLFQHGNYDIASNSIIWKAGVTQTLPASFYRGAKPSWFGSVPWPPIGPEVTGGNIDTVILAGHANSIPAKVCYDSEARDANGIKLFDPIACYAAAPSVPNITTLTLPGATQTGAYSTTLAVSGGTPAYTWSLNAGTLPAGLSLNASTGIISGTTSGTGTSSFTIRVTDAGAQTDTQALNIVVALAPAVTTTSLPAATKNLAYSTTLAVTDGTLNYSWSVIVGSLPTGLSLNAATGAIAGTPTIAGTSSFTVRVSDANSVTATKALSITVNAPAVITTTSPLPQATQGSAYTTTISATGGTPAYIWSISAGTLPIGLSINSGSGVISGTPSVAGTYSFTVRVTDAVALFSDTPFSMIVNPPPQVTVVTSFLPNGTIGISYSTTVTASSGTTPYTWSISVGSLPAGLSLNTTTGFISGTPTASGVTSFTVRVVDVNSTSDTKPLSITVPVPNTTVGAPKGTMP